MDYPSKAYEPEYTTSDVPTRIAVLEDFDRELERFEKLVMGFADRLDPVLNQYAREQVAGSEPRPEASSHVRGRIDRLRDVAAKFDRILADIDL
jgi:hypothetical protein